MVRRIAAILGVLTVLVAGLAVPAFAGAENSFVAEINAERAAAGLEPLEVYWDLVDDARAHSQVMM
ncbi:MAG: hypothetical protein HKO87_06840, partial [Acidimicrobiia bacterium]|nr:hypothetical protein [Acidimicrobiia bacterium]